MIVRLYPIVSQHATIQYQVQQTVPSDLTTDHALTHQPTAAISQLL
jgi:hypothetical protein